MPRLPYYLIAYRLFSRVIAPLVPIVLRRRMARGKEDGARLRERLGFAGRPRPAGQLVWIHGASVGECVAGLTLIAALNDRLPGVRVLVTSGTVTGAQVMAARLPDYAFHQYLPVDTPGATARFLDHWRPDVGLFIDSDLWPNLLLGAHARRIPVAVVNARMSPRSFHRWRRLGAGSLFSTLSAVLAQDADEAARFRALGARDVRVSGSLKADAAPLGVDANALSAMQGEIGARPVFLAAQTHGGEEETLLPATDMLLRRFPDLLSIIVPRHPNRADDIVAMCGDRPTVTRSSGQHITAETKVYVADTIGEMGLFYRLADFAFVGGSLIVHGGQNPLEPAKLGRAVLAGPHTFNFVAAYRAIFAAQGLGLVASAGEIAAQAAPLLADPARAAALGAMAADGARQLGGASVLTADFVCGLLDHAGA